MHRGMSVFSHASPHILDGLTRQNSTFRPFPLSALSHHIVIYFPLMFPDCLFNFCFRAGAMCQRFRELDVLADDLHFIPSTNMEAHSLPVPGDPAPSSDLCGNQTCMQRRHKHEGITRSITNLIKMCMMFVCICM